MSRCFKHDDVKQFRQSGCVPATLVKVDRMDARYSSRCSLRSASQQIAFKIKDY